VYQQFSAMSGQADPDLKNFRCLNTTCGYVELLPENSEVWELYSLVWNQVVISDVSGAPQIIGLDLARVGQVMEMQDIARHKRGEYLKLLIALHDVIFPVKKVEKKKETPDLPPHSEVMNKGAYRKLDPAPGRK
jgi:hypothetical protein